MRRILTLGILIFALFLSSAQAFAKPPASAEEAVLDVLPFHYGRVASQGLAIYENPGDAAPARRFTSAGTWVSIRGQRVVDGETWYFVDRGGWTPASAVAVGQPSAFRGVRVLPGMSMPFGFVIADLLNVRAQPGVSDDNPPIDELERYTTVSILDEKEDADGIWYRIGEGRWVSARYVRRVAPVVPPEQVGPDERWIEVNLRQQTLAAYEGPQMVYATLVSSGLPQWQTIAGLFRIWVKIKHRKMSGGSFELGDYYYLADVPWTMYFKGSYALHAAYWHDDFGRPKSHGCVNLSPLDAYWLFQWATPDLDADEPVQRSSEEDPGTWVFVHTGTQPEALNLASWDWDAPAHGSFAVSSTPPAALPEFAVPKPFFE